MQSITNFTFFNTVFPHIYLIFYIVAILLTNISIRVFLFFLRKRLAKKSELLEIFCSTVNKPLRYIIWIIGSWLIVTHILNWSGNYSNSSITNIFNIAIKLSILLCFFLFSNNLAKKIKSYFIKKLTRTDGGYNNFSMIEACYKGAQVLIIIGTFFITLSALDISIVALAGMATVVTGFVAISQQELIKNLFGGTVLYIDRPFSVGDWIYTIDGKIEGTVERISFRLTQVRGFDKRPIYIPNSTFLSTSVVNASRMSNRRILQYIGIRYQDFKKIHIILEAIKIMLKNSEHIDQKCTTLVCVVNGNAKMGSNIEGFFGASSLNFMIYTFTKTTNWVEFQNIQNSIMIKVGEIINDNGAEIAFPTMTLDFPKDTLYNLKQECNSTP